MNHGCRCFACRLGCSQARAEQRKRRNQRPHFIPATEARAHINNWRTATGRGQIVFAHAAGISPAVVRRIITGDVERIRRTTHDAVLSVPLDRPFPRYTHLISALPTRRRAQALAAIGWSFKQQSAMVNRSKEWLSDLLGRDFVTPETANMIAGLYEQLSMRLPPETTKGERISARRGRALAARKGWPPPLAWDDIDDPTETPNLGGDDDDIDPVVVMRLLAGHNIPATRAERTETIRRWVADGRPTRELNQLYGWKIERYWKHGAAA
jgi:hypothetical protein